jgi:hypothetical protein
MRASPSPPEPAPRRLRAEAGAIDTAVNGLIAGALWLYSRRGGSGSAGGDDTGNSSSLGNGASAQRVALGVGGLLGERFGSPGQRIVGLRTVDSRSGEPVALKVSLALAGLKLGSGLVNKRLARAAAPARTARVSPSEFGEEVQALRARFGEDADGLNAALMAHYQKHRAEPPAAVNFLRPIAVGFALSVVQRRLRRSLAPTVVVVSRP